MNIGAIGSSTPNYTPQKTGGQGNTAQLESQLDTLNKQLKEIKQDDKLAPEKKKKQIENIEKKIAEIEKRIAQMRREDNNIDEKKLNNVQKQDLPEKPLQNHVLDEYV